MSNNSSLTKDANFTPIQAFTPPATSPIVTISAPGDVTVSGYRLIMFQDEVTIYYGSDSSNTFTLPACIPLGIADGVTTIHVDAATAMMVM